MTVLIKYSFHQSTGFAYGSVFGLLIYFMLRKISFEGKEFMQY